MLALRNRSFKVRSIVGITTELAIPHRIRQISMILIESENTINRFRIEIKLIAVNKRINLDKYTEYMQESNAPIPYAAVNPEMIPLPEAGDILKSLEISNSRLGSAPSLKKVDMLQQHKL